MPHKLVTLHHCVNNNNNNNNYIINDEADVPQVWAVLTKRQALALLLWQHGEEALAKSLVAAKLYKALASEAADDDLETEVYEELRSYAKEFETLGNKIIKHFCHWLFLETEVLEDRLTDWYAECQPITVLDFRNGALFLTTYFVDEYSLFMVTLFYIQRLRKLPCID